MGINRRRVMQDPQAVNDAVDETQKSIARRDAIPVAAANTSVALAAKQPTVTVNFSPSAVGAVIKETPSGDKKIPDRKRLSLGDDEYAELLGKYFEGNVEGTVGNKRFCFQQDKLILKKDADRESSRRGGGEDYKINGKIITQSVIDELVNKGSISIESLAYNIVALLQDRANGDEKANLSFIGLTEFNPDLTILGGQSEAE